MVTQTRPLPPGDAPTQASGACAGCGQVSDETRCPHCGVAQRAGEYRVLRVVHQSARGRLYLAEGPDGRRVALKELVFATVPDVETIEAFEREAAVLRQLEHERIPRFLASFQAGQGVHTRLYLAQTYVEGHSLAQRLEAHRFDEVEAKAIARQVLEVLAFLHGRSPRVLHRDLKPSNLIQRPDGSIAVVDFGASRDLASSVTHGSTLVGTFGYMPPEQLGGTVSPSSDLYALGATLVHLLSRKPPGELLDPSMGLAFEKAVNVSPLFSRFLARLTSRDPAQRFQTAAAALAALDAKPTAAAAPQATRPFGARNAQSLTAALAFESRVEHAVARGRRTSTRVGLAVGALSVGAGSLAVASKAHFPWPLLVTFLLPGYFATLVGRELTRWSAARKIEGWAEEHAIDPEQRLELILAGRKLIARYAREDATWRRRDQTRDD
ncbi:MAG: serine/threonine protein kinase [Myxococcaceae bacterium]|nr:serine/threonine protein kinase [Myxococcaceae bacterium]